MWGRSGCEGECLGRTEKGCCGNESSWRGCGTMRIEVGWITKGDAKRRDEDEDWKIEVRDGSRRKVLDRKG